MSDEHTHSLWVRTRAIVMATGSLPALIGAGLAFFVMTDVDSDVEATLLTGLVTLAVSGLVLGWLAARQFLLPMMQHRETSQVQVIQDIEAFKSKIVSGNLLARITTDSPAGKEVTQAINVLNELAEILHQMVKNVEAVSGNVDESSSEILRATNEQIANATDQDASVMQTSSTVQEVRATVTETAERAAAVAEMAQTSVDVSKAGEQAVAEAIEGMNLIRQRVESIADNILVLSEHTQQIGEIIATVSGLADQSKLLALNASVEAARAGAEGKGFAVVAMEVRNLAEQSREATAQVRDILSEIQQATNSAVMVTEEGTKGVDVGVALVNRAGESIRELAGTIEEAAYSAIQIAASTREQTVGMDQLTSAINNIRQTTAHATTATMSVERAARELNSIARRLGEMVERYQT